MAKSRAGIPEGFTLNVERPVELGDYLDESSALDMAQALAAKQRSSAKPAPESYEPPPSRPAQPPPRPQLVPSDPSPPPLRNEQVLDLAEARRRSAPKAQVAKRPERMQVNMRPETQKMFGDLVEFVQRYSLQEDAKASEIQDALISMLYQARSELTLHDVPRRGKWGTPTARAFPTALGNAFARAIAKSYAKSGRDEG
jgi:hypothetical protein